MKTTALLLCAVSAGILLAAAPAIRDGSVVMTQDQGTRLVTIGYELTGGPAIVTLDIQTNVTGRATADEADWISVGDACFRDVTGDVNKLVPTTGPKRINWNPLLHFTDVVPVNGVWPNGGRVLPTEEE